MTLMKSALLASATTLVAVAGAQAADLPSKKAAPATYVKVCDAYGAGFFYIPGTDTCVKIGGYVRAEYQYVPGKDTYTVRSSTTTGTPAVTVGAGVIQQSKKDQSETGYEVRGRIDIDARTPTALGVARTFVRLRGANTSGVRNASITNFGGNSATSAGTGVTLSDASSTTLTVESALVQWAGFTFGVAPENYAMMSATQYNANPYAGFPNGAKQIAYTANFGGGLTATLALEDRRDFGYDQTVSSRPATAGNVVGNIRLDQGWGFAAVHGAFGNNSLTNASVTGVSTNYGQKTYSSWALGTTVSFKLPMISAGDQLWLTANYTDGMLGSILTAGGLSNVNKPANARLLGGLLRVDTNLVQTAVATGTTDAKTFDNVTAWNIGGQFTHYWAAQWRSNFVAGYVEVTPPNSTVANTWGKGQLQTYIASLIYSPVKDLDIGLEVEYANLKSKLQNGSAAYLAAGSPGLHENNFTTKLRIERAF